MKITRKFGSILVTNQSVTSVTLLRQVWWRFGGMMFWKNVLVLVVIFDEHMKCHQNFGHLVGQSLVWLVNADLWGHRPIITDIWLSHLSRTRSDRLEKHIPKASHMYASTRYVESKRFAISRLHAPMYSPKKVVERRERLHHQTVCQICMCVPCIHPPISQLGNLSNSCFHYQIQSAL